MTVQTNAIGLIQQLLLRSSQLLLLLSVFVNSGGLLGSAFADDRYGRFSGQPVIKLMTDGFNVQLVEGLTFTDYNKRKWYVPSGSQTNGASIPRFLWISYPPFTGKYRIAAIIHDHYCVIKDYSWQNVHRMFYDAMRAAGVDKTTAKAMYAAVYFFGPRWKGTGKSRSIIIPNQLPDPQKEKIFKELKRWIEEERPTPREIRQRAQSLGLQ